MLCGKDFGPQFCMRFGEIAVNRHFLDNVAVFEALVELNVFLVCVVDETGTFGEYLRGKYGERMRVMGSTRVEGDEEVVEKAMKNGEVLVIEEADTEMFSLLSDYLDYFDRKLNTQVLQRVFLGKRAKDPKDLQWKGVPLDLHKDFRLIFLTRKEEDLIFRQELGAKVTILTIFYSYKVILIPLDYHKKHLMLPFLVLNHI